MSNIYNIKRCMTVGVLIAFVIGTFLHIGAKISEIMMYRVVIKNILGLFHFESSYRRRGYVYKMDAY